MSQRAWSVIARLAEGAGTFPSLHDDPCVTFQGQSVSALFQKASPYFPISCCISRVSQTSMDIFIKGRLQLDVRDCFDFCTCGSSMQGLLPRATMLANPAVTAPLPGRPTTCVCHTALYIAKSRIATSFSSEEDCRKGFVLELQADESGKIHRFGADVL